MGPTIRHAWESIIRPPPSGTRRYDLDARADRLAELSVIAQVANVCHTTIAQDAWFETPCGGVRRGPRPRPT